jgi:hypothetical protein
MVQAGGSQRFCVHEFWWAEDISDDCCTCSSVLHIAFLFFREREKEGKKIGKTAPVGRLATAGPQCTGF